MLVTVFTPTYNRASTIVRTYQSLCRQKMKDFEWLVVDDGSTDETESLISSLMPIADFPINYIKKTNGGKHTAYNKALLLAKGKLFFTVDSDDWLPDDSLISISSISNELLSSKQLAGLIALKTNPEGRVIGKQFPKKRYVSSLKELEASGYSGERSIVFKTEVAQRYPFPEIESEKFMGESVVYDRIGKDFDFIIENDILMICEYQPDGLSSHIHRTMLNNPGGYLIYYAQRIDEAISLRYQIKYVIRYNAFKYLSDKEIINKYQYKGKNLFLTRFFSPIGAIAAMIYKYKGVK